MHRLAYPLIFVSGVVGSGLWLSACGDNGTGQGDEGAPLDFAVTADLVSAQDLAMGRDLNTGADLTTLSGDLAGADLTPVSQDLASVDLLGADLIPPPDLTFTCTANAFISCTGNNAVYCNAQGNGTTNFNCGGACVGNMGCGICTPSSTTCANGMLTTCTPQGSLGTPVACVTLGATTGTCADATTCLKCTGTNVCGNGSNGSVANRSYTCAAGMISMPVACAYGCDTMNGQCADVVPANQAAAHLAGTGNEVWTCTGTKTTGLPDLVTTMATDVVAINTGAGTITLNGNLVTGALWGAPYTPTGSGTLARVVHVKSINLTAGTTVNVTGTAALILLSDGDVSIAGAVGMVTSINLAANKTTSGGPGADTATANAAGSSGASTSNSGGGGSGHGTDGAKGGSGNAGLSSNGGAAGKAFGAVEALEAGASGGAGDGTALSAGKGGGAMQITACGSANVTANVVINASGGGGKGGAAAINQVQPGGGGGGGGSGGTLLIEGNTLTIAGALVSNGGGGGEGGAGQNNPGGDGANWDPATPVSTPAPGGNITSVAGAGLGGNGGAGATTPAAGVNAGSKLGGGGGGGAYGKIFLNDSPLQSLAGATNASPTPKASHVCVTVNGTAPASCSYP